MQVLIYNRIITSVNGGGQDGGMTPGGPFQSEF